MIIIFKFSQARDFHSLVFTCGIGGNCVDGLGMLMLAPYPPIGPCPMCDWRMLLLEKQIKLNINFVLKLW